jgi:hypothetical protein
MPKITVLERSFADAIQLYQRGDVLGAVEEFLQVAQTGGELAGKVLPYLFKITDTLDTVLQADFGSFERKRIISLRRELNKWAAKKPMAIPDSAQAMKIRVAVGDIVRKTGSHSGKPTLTRHFLGPSRPATLRSSPRSPMRKELVEVRLGIFRRKVDLEPRLMSKLKLPRSGQSLPLGRI